MDAVKQLETTPEILRAMMDGLAEDEANWKPAANRFSVAEVLEHLSHVEGHCFRMRLDLSMERDGAPWEPYDPADYDYSGADPEESFAHWEDQRESNLEVIRALPEGWEKRTGRHPRMGVLTLGELVNEWAFHDLGHIRQIAELIRARKYYPNMGPFRENYKINP